MTDLQATLDAIDRVAVHQCGYCSEPLAADSESLDYCSDECQAWWLAERHEVQELVGYREPYDLPQHESNLVELYSPEITPAEPDWSPVYWYGLPRDNLVFDITLDTSRLEASFRAAGEAMQRFAERMAEAGEAWRRACSGLSPDGVWVDEVRGCSPLDLINKITVSDVARVFDVPEALIVDCREPFGSDFDFEHRTATTLPDESPAAVMPDLPPRDWQAIVDAATSHAGPVTRVTAARSGSDAQTCGGSRDGQRSGALQPARHHPWADACRSPRRRPR